MVWDRCIVQPVVRHHNRQYLAYVKTDEGIIMETKDSLQQILDIGIALTAEKNPDKLLRFIIQTAMELTNSDAGTLFLIKDDTLVFRIMKTLSKGIDLGEDGKELDIPPVPLSKENICAYAAINREPLNIADVYESDLFDFSGPKNYDALIGYRTTSMVAIPMIGRNNEVIGVMQLINAMDAEKKVREFTADEVRILMALSSQTAISLSNMAYLEEITIQMWSFTEALTEAIDARTPYNASHTRNVALYAGYIVDHINVLFAKNKETHFFDKEHRDQIVLAAYLHDIGKMIVPTKVMNKQTRMDNYMDAIVARLEIIELKLQIEKLKGLITDDEYDTWRERLGKTRKVLKEADKAGFLNDELLAQVLEICGYIYKSADESEIIPFFTEEEKECLTIRKGTLTADERKIMESHVEMTERILSKVHFNRSFSMAPVWAAQHHECINGKGYPEGIEGDALGIEARILAVADICDALLATDRPYKKPLPKEKAFAIMEDMAKSGMIDEVLVGYMKECI